MSDYTKEAEVLTGQVLDLCHRLAYPAPTVKRILTAFARQQRAAALEEAADDFHDRSPGQTIPHFYQADEIRHRLRALANEIEEDEE
jgi:hypothetical protein